MLFGRRTIRRNAFRPCVSLWWTVGLLTAGMLLGCGEACNPHAERCNLGEDDDAWTCAPNECEAAPLMVVSHEAEPRIAALVPYEEWSADQDQWRDNSAVEAESPATDQQYWEFPDEASNETAPELFRLPTLEDDSAEKTVLEQPPVAKLLPPQPIEYSAREKSVLVAKTVKPTPLPPIAPEAFTPVSPTSELAPELADPPQLPELTSLSEQQRLLNALIQDSTSSATGVPTDVRVSELAKQKIQHAYTMAGRGSLYVARQELVEVLRMLSQAKDSQQGSPDRSAALAAGLRALREAEDFAPRGTQLEAELDVALLCASHRTPLAEEQSTKETLPRVMMDRYLRYAQLQLALSVAGEPAGSMALHALGKISRQLGNVEPNKHVLADRHAIAYQQAALLAHDQNYLAAHELGVLLAASGHYAEAHQLFAQVARRSPNAVVLSNLAQVQQHLGQSQLAAESQTQAKLLAQQGATGTSVVQLVAPQQFTESRPPMESIPTPRPAVQLAQRPTQSSLIVPGTRQPMPR